MTTITKSNADFCVESIDCIEPSEYLLNPLPGNKSHSLVLDIDETLLSVRRWVDEIQIHDKVLYNATHCALRVVKITKEVTLQFDDGSINVYSFQFTQQRPFGQLASSLDVGDRMDIGDRIASVKEVFTSYMTIYDEARQLSISINCAEDSYLHQVQYMANPRDSKFSTPDMVYDNLYLVRFRNNLASFFAHMTAHHSSLEIVLWTAAVRSVYTGLMAQVHEHLRTMLKVETPLWHAILYRDNCTARVHGGYLKDLSQLGRPMDKLLMVDNIGHNFEGFESNGLPVDEYWGHSHDGELSKLCRIVDHVMYSGRDVRCVLHQSAFYHGFSTFKLDAMLRWLSKKQLSVEMSQEVADSIPMSSSEQEEVSMDCMDSMDSMSNETDQLEFYLFNELPTGSTSPCPARLSLSLKDAHTI